MRDEALDLLVVCCRFPQVEGTDNWQINWSRERAWLGSPYIYMPRWEASSKSFEQNVLNRSRVKREGRLPEIRAHA